MLVLNAAAGRDVSSIIAVIGAILTIIAMIAVFRVTALAAGIALIIVAFLGLLLIIAAWRPGNPYCRQNFVGARGA
jgi:hypothetical protein